VRKTWKFIGEVVDSPKKKKFAGNVELAGEEKELTGERNCD